MMILGEVRGCFAVLEVEGDVSVADFLRVTLDGTEVLIQSAESDLVRLHGGEPEVRTVEAAGEQLQTIAVVAERVATKLREKLAPDELQLEVGVGLSGEVGWFFAKSHAEATLNVTLTWKK